MQQIWESHQQALKSLIPLLQSYEEAESRTPVEAECKKALTTYLEMQSLTFIKDLQVMLHIGKTKEELEGYTPKELYTSTMEAFNTLKGWRPKEIEIQNMIIKAPLSLYLEKGLRILQINDYK